MTAPALPPEVESKVLARFFSRVNKTDSCWLWTGASWLSKQTGLRSGSFHSVHVDECKAHRAAYVLLVGPIPEGLTLDHKCRQTLCVNPDHLEPVSRRENIMRGNGTGAINARKTACIHGHELSGANLRMRANGWRICRVCARAEKRRRRVAAAARAAKGGPDAR